MAVGELLRLGSLMPDEKTMAQLAAVPEFVLVDGYYVLPRTGMRLWFDETAFGFRAGCNYFQFQFEYVLRRNGTLAAPGYAMSLIGCDEPRYAQDDWFAAFMTSSPTLIFHEGQLTLQNTSATLTFVPTDQRTAKVWSTPSPSSSSAPGSHPPEG